MAEEILSQWVSISVWVNQHQDEDNIGDEQIAHGAFSGNVFSSGSVILTITHKLLPFTSLKLQLGSGRDGFNYIIRGCETRRWHG